MFSLAAPVQPFYYCLPDETDAVRLFGGVRSEWRQAGGLGQRGVAEGRGVPALPATAWLL